MEGYIYLLQHPDKPGYVKIGRTARLPQKRLAEHNERGHMGETARTAGRPWELIHYFPVKDASKAEAYVWDYLCVPKFGKIELHPMPLDAIVEVLMACEYLDKDKYSVMLHGELREYDVSGLLDSIRMTREKEAAERTTEKKRLRVLRAAETRRRNNGGDI